MIPNILITGGNGLLATELTSYCEENSIVLHAPDKYLCDITNEKSIQNVIDIINPNIMIHAAAYVDTIGCENNIKKAIDINTLGTINLVKCCLNTNIKVCYISTEYVFSGNKGEYSIDDRLDPINIYGKTKAASEYIISTLNNYQIIRVPFIRKLHKNVFGDQYCSRYFLNEIPEKILNNILYNNDKIVHISRNKMKLCDIYKSDNHDINIINIPDEIKHIIPKDTSLINTSKY